MLADLHLLDSGALKTLNKVLGAIGGGQHTYVDSGHLQLALTANQLIRRGRTIAASEGMFGARMTNTHAGPGNLTLTVDPYAPTTPGAGYPSPVPEGYDVWMLNAQAAAAIGVASTTIASRLVIQLPATSLAFGSAGTVGMVYRAFLGELPSSGTVAFLRQATDNPVAWHWSPVRIPRGAVILWGSSAAVAGDMIAELALGLFPAGLGQDAVGTG